MADENASAGPGAGLLRDGYEQLRERVLAGRPDGWRLGHAVLARRGMAAWIAAQAALASTPTSPAGASAGRVVAAAPGPAGECGQIVAVLAQMALAHAA